ncbi:hypothetical protein UCDDS831_g05927 [Diplodia seriata]|uniref:Uncharacterized protein n=1 Tax=Diplodia seriata TaxID=420778 RepID=A0A0G2GP78_9PEZI|nr:hypothetical protein UCDDS831_g05927 [Diplodia seriata]
MLRPRTKLEWSYFGVTTTQAIVIIALQLAVLLNYLDWVHPWAYQVPLAYTYPISIAVIIAGIAYQAILTLDAFRIKNNIQLFAQCIANICLSIATTMQYGQLKHAASRVSSGHASYPDEPFTKDRPFWAQTQPLLIISIIASCSSTVGMVVLAIKLHREFSWALYKDISADLEIRGRYFAYQVYLVLIKLTFYFVFSFVVIYAFVNVHYQQPEFALTLAVIPLSLLTIGLAVYYTRKEARIGMALTIIIYLSAAAWLISRMVVICGTGIRSATVLRDEQILFAGVGIGFLLAASGAAVRCLLNFDSGLKPILLGQTQRKGPAVAASSRTALVLDDDDVEGEYYFQRLNYVAPSTVDLNRRFALD